MKYVWTTLQVGDLNQSLEFYQQILGLKLVERHPAGPGVEIAFLGEGDTRIELLCHKGRERGSVSKGISMGFQVDSLEDMRDHLKAKGVEKIGEIIEPNGEVRFFFIHDPDGYPVQLVEMKE